MKRSGTERRRRFIIRVEMKGPVGRRRSLRCGGRQGVLRSRRQLRGAPLTAFLAPA
jgi:hypothetical protein